MSASHFAPATLSVTRSTEGVGASEHSSPGPKRRQGRSSKGRRRPSQAQLQPSTQVAAVGDDKSDPEGPPPCCPATWRERRSFVAVESRPRGESREVRVCAALVLTGQCQREVCYFSHDIKLAHEVQKQPHIRSMCRVQVNCCHVATQTEWPAIGRPLDWLEW